jgi:hypothetical protein
MGYETKAVLAVNKEEYGEVDWGKFSDLVSHKYVENDKITYMFDWGKQTYQALDYFMERIAVKDEEGYAQLETFGAISIGEDDTDIESLGEPWEFGIYLTRDIEFE